MSIRSSSGFTLIEVVLALFFIAIGVIATAPLFVYASKQNASGKDLGTVGAAAVRRMEILRSTDFGNLDPGGDLESNVAGYFDAADPEVLVRWTVIANPNPPAGTRVVTVRAMAAGSIRRAKDATLVTIRGI